LPGVFRPFGHPIESDQLKAFIACTHADKLMIDRIAPESDAGVAASAGLAVFLARSNAIAPANAAAVCARLGHPLNSLTNEAIRIPGQILSGPMTKPPEIACRNSDCPFGNNVI